MISKGPHIPEARSALALAASCSASMAFEEWAGVSAGVLPDNPIDAVQVQLMRWQRDRFGHVPTSDPLMALGVVEELGELFDEDATAQDAIDGLGDVMVYSAQLCTSNRLAVRPVIDLACRYTQLDLPAPIVIAGRLAHVMVKHTQRIRGLGDPGVFRLCLVDALAMMIAKAIEDCSISHELVIDPAGVLLVIGAEVMARKAGDAMIPKVLGVQPGEVPAEPDGDTDVLPCPDLFIEVPPRHMMSITARDLELSKAASQLRAGVDLLAKVKDTEPGDFDISDVVSHTGICPQCAAPMSYDGSKPLYTCSNGHSITPAQLKALAVSALPTL